jgi:hypothetical protein
MYKCDQGAACSHLKTVLDERPNAWILHMYALAWGERHSDKSLFFNGREDAKFVCITPSQLKSIKYEGTGRKPYEHSTVRGTPQCVDMVYIGHTKLQGQMVLARFVIPLSFGDPATSTATADDIRAEIMRVVCA